MTNKSPQLPTSDKSHVEQSEAQTVGNLCGSHAHRARSLYELATFVVLESRVASISLIQRRLKIGYQHACELMIIMGHNGIVSLHLGKDGFRKILLNRKRRSAMLRKLKEKNSCQEETIQHPPIH